MSRRVSKAGRGMGDVCARYWSENLKERDNLEELDVETNRPMVKPVCLRGTQNGRDQEKK
jgi:hypothetical protein